MKILKSLEEVEAAGLSPPVQEAAHGVLKALINAYEEHGQVYDPEDDGHRQLRYPNGEEGERIRCVLVQPSYRRQVRQAETRCHPHHGSCVQPCNVRQHLPEVRLVGLLELVLDKHERVVDTISGEDIRRECLHRDFLSLQFNFDAHDIGQLIQMVCQPRGKIMRLVGPSIAHVDAFQPS